MNKIVHNPPGPDHFCLNVRIRDCLGPLVKFPARALLALGLICLVMAQSVQAQEFISGDYVAFNEGSGTCTIMQYLGSSGALTIPNAINGLTIVEIEGAAFANCFSLTSVTIPNSVTNIGYYAFGNCLYLTSVTIPNSVTSIGDQAFSYCERLTSITFGSGLISMGSDVFDTCFSLTDIIIPKSVTSIGEYVFSGCSALNSAFFEGDAPPDSGTAFSGDTNIVYYLSGTTGWGSNFGGVSAVLWNPQATAFSVTGSNFGFSIVGPTSAVIVVEACTNLVNPVWFPVSTNTLSGSGNSSFSESNSVNYTKRFYRFRSP